jgi:hypothetical protein
MKRIIVVTREAEAQSQASEGRPLTADELERVTMWYPEG